MNALNSPGVDVFMADFGDSFSPTWVNVLGGQYNMLKAIKRNLRFYDSERRKEYSVLDIKSQVMLRPRPLILNESHMIVDGTAVNGALFDFTVYAFNNWQTL